jgi:ATP-dependent helicase/nuclease subunit A
MELIAVPQKGLTGEQEQAAARRSGSLLLSAGAGSGKTSVLVERFVRAVREDGIAPGRILAITFTERAAGELRERVRARLLELCERDAAREAEEAFISTFHGFCARLLRTHPLQAGVDPGFQVLEEGLASRLALLAFGDALRGFLEDEPPHAVDLVAAYGADALQRIVLGAHSQLRSQGQTEPRLTLVGACANGDSDEEHRAAGERDEEHPAKEPSGGEGASSTTPRLNRRAADALRLIDDLLQRFGQAYHARKRARGTLDFDDLELCARDLLCEREHIRRAWAERFQMLMVDEFQDTNPRQLELLQLLDRDNLFTVGDELQSIYGFRHAEVSLFRERRERLGEEGAGLALTHNFRSRPPILAAVERVFKERLGTRYTPLIAAREPAQGVVKWEPDTGSSGEIGSSGGLASGGDAGEPLVELLLTDCRGWKELASTDDALERLPEATPWRVAEARLLAARIVRLVRDGQASAGEVVVLLRALGDLPLYESALRAAGLPTLATMGDFWGHQQVGDLIAYLRALCNPLDELALYGTLASPLVGLSSDGLALVARAARERGAGAWEAIERAGEELDALLAPRDAERMRRFRGWFALERRSCALHPLAQLLRRAISWSGYDAHVLSLQWGERHLANARKLLRLTRTFEALQGRDLRGFLDHVAHLGSALGGREADAPVVDAELDAVRLLSIHSAKGLEFPVVCVADLGRTPTLSVPDLLLERDGRIGLRLATLGEPELMPALDFEQLRAESRAAQQDEEDRILYVAMTRARDRLLLSGAVDFARWPTPKQCAPPIAWVAPALVRDIRSLAEAGDDDLTVDLSDGLRVRCRFNRPDFQRQSSSFAAPEVVERSSVPPAYANAGGNPAAMHLPDEVHPTAAVKGLDGVHLRDAVQALEETPLSDPDSTISYSSLAELERCGYRYYLERVLRMGERHGVTAQPANGALQARTRGTIVHLLLETIDFARPRPPTESDVGRIARRIGARVAPTEREEIAALVTRALDAEMAQRIARGHHPRREHPFAFSLSPQHPLLTGVLDLLVHEPGESILIVDYKSDRVSADDDLEGLVEREYGLQRLLYALAAIEGGAERVQLAHWFLERPGEPVCASFCAAERPALREQLLGRLQRLRSNGFSVADVPHRGVCLTCPGRGTLCSWGETHTLREPSSTLESPPRVATLTF